MQADRNAEVHPRPQLTRERWIDLCGMWEFAYDDADIGVSEKWWEQPEVFNRQIIVPFPPESPASGIGDRSFHPVVWYRRTFQLESQDQDKQILLHFGAVDYMAQV